MTLVMDNSILENLGDNIVDMGNAALDEIVALAVGFAPHRSGELRGGIRVLKRFSKGNLSGEVGVVGVRHAPFIHFGTRKLRARPFLQQAYDVVAPKFVESLRPRFVQLTLSAASYAFAPGTRQYTYLQPGQMPPDSQFNYIPVTPGRITSNFSN